MAVSRRLRYEVLRRDNYTCRYCGASAPDVKLTVDHVTPTALGGSDEPSNLVTACQDCNAGKAASSPDAPLVDDVRQDALRWAKARQRAAELMAAEREMREAYLERFYDEWSSYSNVMGRIKPLPEDWRESIGTFYKLGLPIEEVIDAVSSAMDRHTVDDWSKFRYAAGICWRKLREIEDEAARLIAEGEV